VEPVSPAALDGLEPWIADLVDRTPGADRWCSTLDWVLPAHRAFAPEAEPLVLRHDDTLALLARYRLPDERAVVAGLEPLWGFACPLLGPRPATGARRLAHALQARPDWAVAVLAGLPPDRDVLGAVGSELAALGRVGVGEGIVRQVADLGGDLAGYWARRSSRFRRNLRRARQAAAARGLTIEDASDQADLHQRVLRIEARSWKGRAGEGLASPAMAEFYRCQLDRLAHQGRVRALVARLDGRDVGFIVGGRRARLYRGLQLSYAEEVRDLSVGHLLQAAELERLADEGVDTYDLGMDLGYKRAWADRAVASVTLVVHRPTLGSAPLR
jgi:CelD/BcsL family acetyltransferase involved in cellulose biosynthesis